MKIGWGYGLYEIYIYIYLYGEDLMWIICMKKKFKVNMEKSFVPFFRVPLKQSFEQFWL